jgi:hypothetical protein
MEAHDRLRGLAEVIENPHDWPPGEFVVYVVRVHLDSGVVKGKIGYTSQHLARFAGKTFRRAAHIQILRAWPMDAAWTARRMERDLIELVASALGAPKLSEWFRPTQEALAAIDAFVPPTR